MQKILTFILVSGGAVLLALGVSISSAQVGGAASTAQPQSGAGSFRVAFVRSQAVLRQMPGYARADTTWSKEAQEIQRELQQMQERWADTLRAFQQASAMMTPSARSAREKALQAKGDSLGQRSQALRDRIDARERELLTPMQTKLQAVIDAIRSEDSLAMIIDLDNPASANIVSYNKSLDITDRVVRRAMQTD